MIRDKVLNETRMWLLQMYALLYKNTMQALRGWKLSGLRVLVPISLVTLLGVIQLVSVRSGPVLDTPQPVQPLSPSMGKLLYYPKNLTVQQVMSHVARKYEFEEGEMDGTHCSADMCGLESFASDDVIAVSMDNGDIAGIVNFLPKVYDTSLPVIYSITYNSTALRPSPFKSAQELIKDYRLPIKLAVDEALMQVFGNVEGSNLELSTIKLPSTLSASQDPQGIISKGIHAVLYVGLFFMFVAIHYGVNQERSSKILQSMMVMGLRDSVYWTTLLIFNMALGIILCIGLIVTGLLTQQSFFLQSDVWAIFLVLLNMCYSFVAMFMFLSSVIRGPRATNIWAFLLLTINLGLTMLFVPFNQINIGFLMVAYMGKWLQILQPVSFGYMIQLIVSLTAPSLGNNSEWQYNSRFTLASMYRTPNVFSSSNLNSRLPEMQETMLYLFFVSTFLLIAAWYLDQVLPGGAHGTTRPIWFPFSPSFWGFTKHSLAVDVASHAQNRMGSVLPDTDKDIYREYQNTVSKVNQSDPENMVPLKIVKLGKTYSKMCRGGTRALDSLTLSANKSNVLALLGHNGAGKTTAVECLTGSISPTSGDALVYGYSVVNEMSSIQSIMGVCPQHDILWNDVTAEEHIWVFSLIKGIYSNVKTIVKERLEFVELDAVGKHRVRTYSGGMKRRLSVAISTIGDPLIIYMDEPTSGLDPVTRRQVWKLVQRLKENRLIVLTTHSMEEAEFLGDKIAILALGRLRAVGSPLHLKSRYGAGYSLTLSVKPDALHNIKQRVQEIHPKARIQEENAGNLRFSVPLHYATFTSRLLEFVEQEHENLEGIIEDWGISHTTLEQVFIRITHGGDNAENDAEEQRVQEQLNVVLEGTDDPIGFVDIDDNTTLVDLRAKISQSIEMAPSEFVFLSQGVALSATQEATKLAVLFIPIITIRPRDQESTQRERTRNEQPHEMEANLFQLEQRIEELEEQLERSASENNQLLSRVHELEEKLHVEREAKSQLEQQLSALQAT